MKTYGYMRVSTQMRGFSNLLKFAIPLTFRFFLLNLVDILPLDSFYFKKWTYLVKIS